MAGRARFDKNIGVQESGRRGIFWPMANHQDAEITEVVVVLDKSCDNQMAQVVEKLKGLGMDVFSTDEDNLVVEGAVESSKLPEIQKLGCVDYVRTVMTYIADFPTGDSRDKDEPDDE